MTEPNLTHDEKAVLAGLLRETIAADRYPLSPRVRSLKAILDKLDPPAPRFAYGSNVNAPVVN